MRKILFFEGDINNAITGFRKDLVNELSKSYEILVIGFCINDIANEANNNIRFIKLGKLSNNLFKNFLYFFKVFKYLVSFKPNITLSYNLRPNIFIGFINYFVKFNSIATITGTTTFLKDNSILKKFILKFFFRKFNFIFFQNERDKNLFYDLDIVSNTRSVLVPGSGINLNNFKRNSKKINRKNIKFILVARLIKEKGIFEYIKAAELIKLEYQFVEFLILGPIYSNGKRKNIFDFDFIRKYEHLNIIKYLGVTNDVKNFIEESDCVVLPSYGEGMSNVLLESCALSTPVIASNVSGCREIIDDDVNGLLCNPMDYKSLYEKLHKFINLNFEKRIEMGKMGRKKMELEFDVKIVLNKYIDKISKL